MTKHAEIPTTELEIWAMIDQDGSYVVDAYEENLAERWSEEIGGTPLNSRTIKLTLTAPLPRGVAISGALSEFAEDGAAIALVAEG
jgi:hypothetical protein